jgi:hypothetical protein
MDAAEGCRDRHIAGWHKAVERDGILELLLGWRVVPIGPVDDGVPLELGLELREQLEGSRGKQGRGVDQQRSTRGGSRLLDED